MTNSAFGRRQICICTYARPRAAYSLQSNSLDPAYGDAVMQDPAFDPINSATFHGYAVKLLRLKALAFVALPPEMSTHEEFRYVTNESVRQNIQRYNQFVSL